MSRWQCPIQAGTHFNSPGRGQLEQVSIREVKLIANLLQQVQCFIKACNAPTLDRLKNANVFLTFTSLPNSHLITTLTDTPKQRCSCQKATKFTCICTMLNLIIKSKAPIGATSLWKLGKFLRDQTAVADYRSCATQVQPSKSF